MSSHIDHSAASSLDASAVLASRIAATRFEDLTPDEVYVAKAAVLDTLGVSLAATSGSAKYLTPFRRYIQQLGDGPVPAPTLGRCLPTLDTILWLGALAHTLDFDDLAAYSHPSGPVASAALPVAHAHNVSGRDLITAVALGQDVVIRLAQSVRKPTSAYGWMPSIPGVIGAAVTTCKLLGADAETTRAAMNLALHQTSGTMQALAQQGSAYRAIREGFNARAGAMTAMLALEGLPDDTDGLEGQFGYFKQMFSGDYEPEKLHKPGLFSPTTAFKRWPCAGHPQLFLTVVAQLMAAGEVDVERIVDIHIEGCSDLLPHQCEPLAMRAAPRASIDAKASIPFLIGSLLATGDITVNTFSAAGLANPKAQALGNKVTWEHKPEHVRDIDDFGLGVVAIRHLDGRVARAEALYPFGHHKNPLPWATLVEKFRNCLDIAEPNLSASADSIIAATESLETLHDTRVFLGATTTITTE